eukprot:CAMPEP_0119307182 /NCGR_PEP_ID=MMETSP1333-20130426/7747_1 /TAXON_ID=418940 /ORGANISM="Scyphosphaera apsteinii, Strain RCC1455" /LENGTH=115 /DNA_ID=CAMNT_0007310665 /DNA_START=604 /DNA_END=951 /DNA_ORIENTATION=+
MPHDETREIRNYARHEVRARPAQMRLAALPQKVGCACEEQGSDYHHPKDGEIEHENETPTIDAEGDLSAGQWADVGEADHVDDTSDNKPYHPNEWDSAHVHPHPARPLAILKAEH